MRKALQRIRESRLSLRLLGLILIVSVGLTVLSSAVQLVLEYRRNVSDIERRLANVETGNAASLANALWSFDDQQIGIQLRGILELPAVEYVEVQTNYGERYAAGSPPPSGDALTRTFELHHVNEGVVPLGTVKIMASLDGVYQQLRERMLVIFATEAITTFLIALFILAIFQRMVTRHLETMAAFAETMRLDRLDQALVLDRKSHRRLLPDELDQVSRSINDMRRSLQAEIGERRKAEAANQFLAEAGKQLSLSLEYQAVADQITELAVSGFADVAVCFAAHRDGSLWPLSVSARSPALADTVRAAIRDRPLSLDLHTRGDSALWGQRTLVIPDITRDLASLAPEPEQRSTHRALGTRSFAAVPLEMHGRRLGVLCLLTRQDGPRTLRPEDAPLIEEFGRRASMALDNALLYEDAQKAIRLRDEFLTVASHELKTPLTSMRLQVQKLERLGRSDMDEQALRSLVLKTGEALDRQIDRLRQLVDALLDVSQILAGGLELTREPVNLTGLVREVVDRLSRPLATAGSTVHLEVAGDVAGRWDPVRLRQVVLSLLSNAMKFGAGQQIDVRLASRAGFAQLSITDRGMGIPREDQDRIFERFTRAVSERHFGGMGLGLFVSRKIVEAHGGTIRVESEPGKGATFIVELPTNLPAPTRPERPAPGELLH